MISRRGAEAQREDGENQSPFSAFSFSASVRLCVRSSPINARLVYRFSIERIAGKSWEVKQGGNPGRRDYPMLPAWGVFELNSGHFIRSAAESSFVAKAHERKTCLGAGRTPRRVHRVPPTPRILFPAGLSSRS